MSHSSVVKSRYYKMRRAQKARAFDINAIDWSSFESQKPLVPISQSFTNHFKLNKIEELCLSQFLGLLLVQSISQHESILSELKEGIFDGLISDKDKKSGFKELGDQFFEEEAKHSKMFEEYVQHFQNEYNIKNLEEILPNYSRGILSKIFSFNAQLGGQAAWWLVMVTEEESLNVYHQIALHKSRIDSLFFQLHHFHYEEERRHMSFAPFMLRRINDGKSFLKRIRRRLDLFLCEQCHRLWLINQFWRLRKLKQLSQEHVFFETLYSAIQKMTAQKSFNTLKVVQRELPIVSDLFRPLRHASITREKKRISS